MSAQDIPAVLRFDPSVGSHPPCKAIYFSIDPACQRVPLEIWEQIAAHTPRYHLRTWLFVSHFHRNIASRHVFHTIDVYFGWDEEGDNFHHGRDIFDRAMNDPIFASCVKSLRLHSVFGSAWHSGVGDMVRTSLPAFKALQNFEWIRCPQIHVEMVQVLLNTHKHLHGLGLIGWSFGAVAVSEFDNLRKLSMSRLADSDVVRTVVDRNESTLKHLILSGYSRGSRDNIFESGTINNLSHLDLVNMNISDFVLTRITHTHTLQSLTLHGSFLDLNSASAVFASDRIIGGSHSLLPHLEAFRLVVIDKNDERSLYPSVIHFLQKREKLRMLNLGSCPWNMVQDILPDLRNLRVLAIRIIYLWQEAIKSFVESIPTQMVAIRLSVDASDKPLNEYARYFTRFNSLSFLHLRSCNYPPNLKHVSKQDLDCRVRRIAATVPSLDFLAWYDELYVVVRSGHMCHIADVEIKELPTSGSINYGFDVGEDTAWLEQKDVPVEL